MNDSSGDHDSNEYDEECRNYKRAELPGHCRLAPHRCSFRVGVFLLFRPLAATGRLCFTTFFSQGPACELCIRFDVARPPPTHHGQQTPRGTAQYPGVPHKRDTSSKGNDDREVPQRIIQHPSRCTQEHQHSRDLVRDSLPRQPHSTQRYHPYRRGIEAG